MTRLALILSLSALALTGCASGNWADRAPQDGVQYQGATMNSPVSDQVHNSDSDGTYGAVGYRVPTN